MSDPAETAPPPLPDPVTAVQALLVEGNCAIDIAGYLQKLHGIEDPAPVIVQALAELVARADLKPDQWRGWCLESFREVYRRLLKSGDYAGALRAIQEIGKLTGCYAKASKKAAPGTAQDDRDNSVLALRVI